MIISKKYLNRSIFEFINLEKELESDNWVLVIISFNQEIEKKDLLIKKMNNLDIDLIKMHDFEMYLLIHSRNVLSKIYEYLLEFPFFAILMLKKDVKKKDVLNRVKKNSFTKLVYGVYHLKPWVKVASVMIFFDVYHLAGFKQYLEDGR